jgi:hypothetical protein
LPAALVLRPAFDSGWPYLARFSLVSGTGAEATASLPALALAVRSVGAPAAGATVAASELLELELLGIVVDGPDTPLDGLSLLGVELLIGAWADGGLTAVSPPAWPEADPEAPLDWAKAAPASRAAVVAVAIMRRVRMASSLSLRPRPERARPPLANTAEGKPWLRRSRLRDQKFNDFTK